MAKKSNWNDDYWLLVVQLYLRKPVGLKPLYSKVMIDLCSEIHVSPSEVYSKMEAIDKLQTPRVERLWRTALASLPICSPILYVSFALNVSIFIL